MPIKNIPEDLQKGDRVLLTAENGDSAEFTIKQVNNGRGAEVRSIYSTHNSYDMHHWDNLTVISRAPRPLPTKPGWYESERFPLGRALYNPYRLSNNGQWVTVSGNVLREITESEVRNLGKLTLIGSQADNN